MTQETYTLSIDELSALVVKIFTQAGMSDQQAQATAKVIVSGERDGCKSHGIYRIEGCLRTIAAGKVEPRAEPELTDDGSAVLRVDAKGAFSPAAFALGAPVLAERARELGVATLVINSCTHFSALWPEIETLTDMGLAALAICPSYASVAPHGGKEPLLGTNPLAFGWPRPAKHPYVFDFATSIAARGEIELHRRAGTQIPEGWAMDVNGEPTIDPEEALAGAMLPFGAHKGSAISTMIELLSGVMIGDMTSPEALENLGNTTLSPHHGELIIAFSPEKFSAGRPGNPFDRAETLFDAILGQGARLPSQRRFAMRDKTMREGVTLTSDEMQSLQSFLS